MADRNTQEQINFLLELNHGLSGVVKALIASLRHSGQLDVGNLRLQLQALPELLDLSADQRFVFGQHLQALDEPAWVPRVVEGGVRGASDETPPSQPESGNDAQY